LDSAAGSVMINPNGSVSQTDTSNMLRPDAPDPTELDPRSSDEPGHQRRD
jgi:hypothetical protein